MVYMKSYEDNMIYYDRFFERLRKSSPLRTAQKSSLKILEKWGGILAWQMLVKNTLKKILQALCRAGMLYPCKLKYVLAS